MMRRLPGRVLLSLARRVVAASELDRVIEPAIADLQHEWSASADGPTLTRAIIRTRAYVAAIRTVGVRIVVAGARATVTPPPWRLVSHVVRPTVIIVAVSTALRLVLRSPVEPGDRWLLEAADWPLVCVVTLPFVWPAILQPRVLEQHRLPAPRASDIAKLTLGICACILIWTGWIAPLLRQQYLMSVGREAAIATTPWHWLLPDVVAAVRSGGDTGAAAFHLHMRLLYPALTAVTGLLAWIELRPHRGKRPDSLAAHFGRNAALGAIAVATMLVSCAWLDIMTSAWMGLCAAGAGALAILLVTRRNERRSAEVRT